LDRDVGQWDTEKDIRTQIGEKLVDGENYIIKYCVTFFVIKPCRIIIYGRKRLAIYFVGNGETIKSYRKMVRKSGKEQPLERQE
jgi:hypothetical protein